MLIREKKVVYIIQNHSKQRDMSDTQLVCSHNLVIGIINLSYIVPYRWIYL